MRDKKVQGGESKKVDVEKLIASEGRHEQGQQMRDDYLQKVLEKASIAWHEEDGVNDKWSAVCSALIHSAEEVLGTVKGSQPDWFRDSLNDLKPLLTLRNTAHSRWLGTRKEEDLTRFKEARLAARRAVREAKNASFQDVAE